MAQIEDPVIQEGADGIQEYDNAPPRWLMALWFGAMIFGIVYLAWYALSFGGSEEYEPQLRQEQIAASAEVQAYVLDHPIPTPGPDLLLAGAADPATLEKGRARFVKTCSPCHGEHAQGLIGPNLTDRYWLHGGKITEIFQTVVGGVPAKGMPPWGRALKPEEIQAVVSYVRSLQGSSPAGAKAAEGQPADPEPIPIR